MYIRGIKVQDYKRYLNFLVEIGIYKKGDSFFLTKFEIIEMSTNFKLKRFYLSDVSL